MKKNILRWIIPILIAAVIAAGTLYTRYMARTRWNDSPVNGNTAGNLYNNGLFCEHNGTVYFSNPDDGHRLYAMPSAGGTAIKLCDDIASFINADDHYVYYVRNNLGGDNEKFSFLRQNTNSLCRYDLQTKKITVLDSDPSLYASLAGNDLFYIHYDKKTASTLYQVKIDGSDRRQVNKNPYFTCSANGQYLYYNGVENDHNIYQYDTVTGSSHAIYEGSCWMPSADNESIYFLDCEQNYALAKLDLNADKAVILVPDRIDSYNVCGDTIYFQRNGENSSAALCSIKTDGSDYREILPGNYINLNAAAQNLYFSQFDNEDVILCMPLSGSGSVSVFKP